VAKWSSLLPIYSELPTHQSATDTEWNRSIVMLERITFNEREGRGNDHAMLDTHASS
jgi:hypothetical protein